MLSLIASTISILAAAVTEGEGLKARRRPWPWTRSHRSQGRYWNSRRRSDRRNDQTARVCGNGKEQNMFLGIAFTEALALIGLLCSSCCSHRPLNNEGKTKMKKRLIFASALTGMFLMFGLAGNARRQAKVSESVQLTNTLRDLAQLT